MPAQRNWTDQRIENVLGNLLRSGVLLSALVVSIGGAIYLIRHGQEPVNFRVFRGEPGRRHIGAARPGDHPARTLTADRDSRGPSRLFDLWVRGRT